MAGDQPFFFLLDVLSRLAIISCSAEARCSTFASHASSLPRSSERRSGSAAMVSISSRLRTASRLNRRRTASAYSATDLLSCRERGLGFARFSFSRCGAKAAVDLISSMSSRWSLAFKTSPVSTPMRSARASTSDREAMTWSMWLHPARSPIRCCRVHTVSSGYCSVHKSTSPLSAHALSRARRRRFSELEVVPLGRPLSARVTFRSPQIMT